MATADQLLELIFCWIEEKERLADNLRKLAEELESLRKKCNVGELVGSSLKVWGAAGMILTSISPIPLKTLSSVWTSITGIGYTISGITKLVEHLRSSTTMKKVQTIEEKSNEIAKEIQQLFQKLKSEKEEENPSAEPDELEHHIMAEFLRAIGRQSGLNLQIIKDSMLNDMLIHTLQEFPLEIMSNMDSCGAGGRSSSAGAGHPSEGYFGDWMGIDGVWGGSSSAGARRRSEGHFGECMDIFDPKSTPQMRKLTSILCAGVLSAILISIHKVTHIGKTKLSDSVIHLLRSTGFQTNMKVVGGVFVMSYALPEMIDNWTELIEGNHVTQASQSLRETAYRIQDTARILKEHIKKIKKMLPEIEKEQQKMNEIEKQLEETEQEQEEESRENEDSPALNVGLLNVCSIKKNQEKRNRIKNIITKNNLDVFLITETWLENDTAYEALREIAPPNFQFNYNCREGRGGGVATLFSQKLQRPLAPNILFNSLLIKSHKSFPVESITTFEYVDTALRHEEWDEDVLFINVYHPPIKTINTELTVKKQLENFIDEFEMLLNMASSYYSSIIVAGDFNLKEEILFKSVRVLRDFVQHVNEPTHKKGGILDLVFSRNVEVFSVYIRNDGISDHFTAYFSIKTKQKDARTKANPLKKEE